MTETTNNNLSQDEFKELYILLVDGNHYLDALDVLKEHPHFTRPKHNSNVSLEDIAKGAITESLNNSDFYTAWDIHTTIIPEHKGTKYHIAAKQAKFVLDHYITISSHLPEATGRVYDSYKNQLEASKILLLDIHNNIFHGNELKYGSKYNLPVEIGVADIERSLHIWTAKYFSLAHHQKVHVANEQYERAEITAKKLDHALDNSLGLLL